MNNCISNIINVGHEVVWKSEILNSIDEVEIICLTEEHENVMQMLDNALLIDNIVRKSEIKKEGVLVMVEAPFSEKISLKDSGQTQYVGTELKCIGWDTDIHFDQEYIAHRRLLNGMQKVNNAITKIIQSNNFSTSEKEIQASHCMNVLLKLLNQAFQEKNDEITLKNCNEYLREYIKDFNKKYVFGQFQNRNNSLINTLSNTEKTVKLCFVIAGTKHFIEDKEDNLECMSVKPLLNYLKDKKAIILKHSD